MSLSPRAACPPAIIGLIRSSSSSCPLAFAVGIINATSFGLSEPPPQPTGPSLQEGSVVPPILATTTRSASLDDSHGFPRCAGYTAGLCPTTWAGLPPRPSLLWVNAPSLRAITSTPRGGTETPQIRPRSQRLSATKQCVSSSSHPTPAPVGDLLTTLQCSLHATARTVAGPPGLVRPRVKRRPPRTYTPELARG